VRLGRPSTGNIISPETCGRSFYLGGTRIVGGQPAGLGQFPWLANLGYTGGRRGRCFEHCRSVDSSGAVKFNCGGSLVGAR
jgi:hypothetical protein